MRFVSLGKIDKNIISILVGCFFCLLTRYLNKIGGSLIFKSSILLNHAVVTNVFISFSKLFMIIPYFINKKRSERSISSNDTKYINIISNTDIKLIQIDDTFEMSQGKVGYLILSALIFFTQSIIFMKTRIIKTNSWIWEIFISSLSYYLIFKIKLYRHHYCSMIIIILIGFIIDLVLGNIQNDIINNPLYLFLRFLREILYSLHDVVNKYLIEKKFCSIYEIALSNGIITLILLILFSVLDYYFFHLDNYIDYFDNFNGVEIFVAIRLMITQLVLYLCTLFTNKNYTPCHIFIIFVFGQLAYYLDFSTHSILIILSLLFILILSLIFNEIIELNFCGLSDNTKKNISIRAEIEEFYNDKCDTTDNSDDNHYAQVELNRNEIYI